MHKENYGVYGIRKIHAQLGREGVTGCSDRPVARCTTQRLMKDPGLRGISRAKGPRTTVPGSGPERRPDLVEREFVADAPDRLWVAYITYCRTYAGWVYATILTLFSLATSNSSGRRQPRRRCPHDIPALQPSRS